MEKSDESGRKLYLGISGQQMGPVSEKEVIEKILSKQIPRDCLIWYEGLPDWQVITSVEFLQASFESIPQEAVIEITKEASPTVDLVQTLSQINPSIPIPENSKAINSPEEGNHPKTLELVFDKAGSFENNKWKKWVPFIAPVGSAVLAFLIISIASKEMLRWLTDKKTTEEITVKSRLPAAVSPRQLSLQQGLSLLLIEPQKSLEILIKLAKEKSDDPVGIEAIQNITEYYTQRQRFAEAGSFLMEVNRSEKALAIFLLDPTLVAQAEEAAFVTFKKSPKQKLLLEDIHLLVGPLNNISLAIERIKLFEQQFPGVQHPYRYYIKIPEEKILDLFKRMSPYFVKNLTRFLLEEFPQLKLATAPLIEMHREGNQYRIVGLYKGDVVLNQDHLSDTLFVIWFYNGQWTIVDTNLTRERKAFCRSEREKHRTESMPASAILSFLEGLFRNEFPKTAIHEIVLPTHAKNTLAKSTE